MSYLVAVLLIVVLCQDFVIRAVRKDKEKLESYTSYRITPNGELHIPDYEI